MRLSEVRGERSIELMADVMELIGEMQGDERFTALVGELKGKEGAEAMGVVFKHVPALLRTKSYQDALIRIFATATGVTEEEYRENGDVMGDLVGFLTTDVQTMGFLSQTEPSSASA